MPEGGCRGGGGSAGAFGGGGSVRSRRVSPRSNALSYRAVTRIVPDGSVKPLTNADL